MINVIIYVLLCVNPNDTLKNPFWFYLKTLNVEKSDIK